MHVWQVGGVRAGQARGHARESGASNPSGREQHGTRRGGAQRERAPAGEVGQAQSERAGGGGEHLRRCLLAPTLHLGQVLRGHPRPACHVGQGAPLTPALVPEHGSGHLAPQGIPTGAERVTTGRRRRFAGRRQGRRGRSPGACRRVRKPIGRRRAPECAFPVQRDDLTHERTPIRDAVARRYGPAGACVAGVRAERKFPAATARESGDPPHDRHAPPARTNGAHDRRAAAAAIIRSG